MSPPESVPVGAPRRAGASQPTHLSPETLERARQLVSLYPEPRSALIPLCHLAQEQDGWLTPAAMRDIAGLVGVTPTEVYVATESPRGELGCYLVADGSSKAYRMHIRGPSFVNLQGLPLMMRGGLLADAVAVCSTIDPVMGEVDR